MLGRRRKIELCRAPIPRTRLPHAAGTRDVVLRTVPQCLERKDTARLYAAAQSGRLRSLELDGPGRNHGPDRAAARSTATVSPYHAPIGRVVVAGRQAFLQGRNALCESSRALSGQALSF